MTGVVLLVAAVAGITLYGAIDDGPPAGDGPSVGLTVDWGGSEGQPSCAYDPVSRTVEARIRIDGTAPRAGQLTVTVTAYADENTSRPVGSGSRTVEVDGVVHRLLLITVPVTKPPHLGEDGETACARSVTY
ncbi:hypothetical protein D4739_02980 [Nocardioides cavernaquae]|uniref:Uncharacterized protein n=1 Tax=Nocardioides cavernaquae TaxID=2321396 RepID=A0A3A5H3D6_9ACTN|nr:hypothetical protein D4739_02980 [Nocardioides cavernaquae]